MKMGLGEPTGTSGWGRRVESLCAQVQFEFSPAGDWGHGACILFYVFNFFYFWLFRVFDAGFSVVAASMGFSLQWLLLLWRRGSRTPRLQ